MVIYILWNCYVFIAMGRDKKRAKLKRWRISEATLLWMGAIFGGVGLFAGMKFFHHKTAHPRFVFGAPMFILLNAVVLGFLIYKHVIV
ncbi:DUF1294 domain-containing protein [Desulfosporosinus acidiphilus]|nr:DUF1294 domain-containing protein [Desulfosporosinus acidiphilus]